jgi:predicted DNA-binding transcriptional regulator AlpA
MLSPLERERRAAQRKASKATPDRPTPVQRTSDDQPLKHLGQRARDRVMRMQEMVETSGLSRWTITRAAQRGELQLIKLTARAIGARESEFWRWVDSKEVA